MTLVKVNNPINKSIDGLMNDLFNEWPASLGKAMREDVLNFPPRTSQKGMITITWNYLLRVWTKLISP